MPLPQQRPGPLALYGIVDLGSIGTCIDGLKFADRSGLMRDGDGDAAVPFYVGKLLALAKHDKVQKEADVGVADERILRPAIGPVRRNRHDPVRVEDPPPIGEPARASGPPMMIWSGGIAGPTSIGGR